MQVSVLALSLALLSPAGRAEGWDDDDFYCKDCRQGWGDLKPEPAQCGECKELCGRLNIESSDKCRCMEYVCVECLKWTDLGCTWTDTTYSGNCGGCQKEYCARYDGSYTGDENSWCLCMGHQCPGCAADQECASNVASSPGDKDPRLRGARELDEPRVGDAVEQPAGAL